ncbi:Type IV fimbrial biogenesis protein PilY1 [Minicystis rosea]|nr:Type IV fimbrial biogenesis protein PilY1 [Minicystis rosea]
MLAAGLLTACGARGTLETSDGTGGFGGAASSSSSSSSSSTSSTSVSSTSVTSSSVSSSVSSTAVSSSGVVCSPEICDGIDNDCNGIVDDGDPGGGVKCQTGMFGICQPGITACKGGDLMCVPIDTPKPEVCDGIDNDCNGIVDDGNPNGGDPCSTGKLGVCALGTTMCKSGTIICGQTVVPSAEICDGLDNDCDGMIDEGCVPPTNAGCSDGTREGYLDVVKYPKIAACSGGWSVPGVLSTLAPACGRMAGNNSGNPSGTGCNVADLCAVGFHVCSGPTEVLARSSTGCGGAAPSAGLFFATRQSSTGCDSCALGTNTDASVCNGMSCQTGCAQTSLTANDLYGCGSKGVAVTSCSILDRASGDQCGSLGLPWSCPNDINEANVVVKATSAGGGVLCCADG